MRLAWINFVRKLSSCIRKISCPISWAIYSLNLLFLRSSLSDLLESCPQFSNSSSCRNPRFLLAFLITLSLYRKWHKTELSSFSQLKRTLSQKLVLCRLFYLFLGSLFLKKNWSMSKRVPSLSPISIISYFSR